MSATSSTVPTKDRSFVTALARGLQILRCFSHEKPELHAADLVRMTGLPQPTIWRLCHTLQRSGLLICPGNGRPMALGVPVLALGFAALVRQKLARIAMPYMEELTNRYRVGASLAVRDGLEMIYLQRTHGDITFMNDPVGARRPISTAPTAWACIAAYSDAERGAVMHELERNEGSRWRTTKRNLQQAVEDYREQGFVLSIGVMHEHFNALAVPIRPNDGGPVHGLSVSGLAAVWTRKKLQTISTEVIRIAHELTAVGSSL